MPKDHSGWYIVFSYEDSGHVADDEKTELDAAAILKSLREGNDEENAERRRRNWAPLQLVGWQVEPSYDAATHYLVWALRVSSEGHESINYNTRMLGRTGVMSANLVVDPDKLQSAIGPSKQLLADYQFTNGSKYAEWKSGDKLAQYGLTGLITGGLVVAAAKTGLLAKLGLIIAKFAKVIIIGVAALGAGIAKFFRSIFGGQVKPNRKCNRPGGKSGKSLFSESGWENRPYSDLSPAIPRTDKPRCRFISPTPNGS